MPNILENKDIVILGLQPWDIEIGSNCKNIAAELSRRNRVLYVNRALDRGTLIKFKSDPKVKNRLRALKSSQLDIVEQMTNLWTFNPSTILESVSMIPFTFLFDRINFINNARLAKQVKMAMAQLEFGSPIIFIDNEFYRTFHLKELIPNTAFIYYIRDYLVEQAYFKKHGLRMETELMKKADLVVSNSLVLAEYAKEQNDSSFFIGQGCDLSLFNPELQREEPIDLRSIKKPRIGYVGALLTSRLHLKLIEDLVKEMSDWSFVFIGPEDDDFKSSMLHGLRNAHFLGSKPKELLADYIAYFDVCFNPQIRNEQTEGNYPLKIDEYLAMGKPTVATYTKAMVMFQEYVYLANDKNEYRKMINASLAEIGNNRKEARIKFARSHTWEKSVNEMDKVLSSTLQQLN